jgi:NAD(P)-dependent dehydrogenase (short-subunit alcohol dehydrogenase family)
MRLRYAARGISAICVCPAAIENTRMDSLGAKLFLASDESSFITAAALPVDGSISIRSARFPFWRQFE